MVRPMRKQTLLIRWRTPAPSDWTHLQTSGGCCVCPPDGFPNLMRKQKKKTSWPIGNKRPCTKLSKNMALGSETEKSGPNFFPFSFFFGHSQWINARHPHGSPRSGKMCSLELGMVSWNHRGWCSGTRGSLAPCLRSAKNGDLKTKLQAATTTILSYYLWWYN